MIHPCARLSVMALPNTCTHRCTRSVADIAAQCFPTLSVVTSPDQLIVGGFFSRCVVIQIICVFSALSSSAFSAKSFYPIFAFLIHQLFTCPKNCSCLFLMVLSCDLSYPAISITSSFEFFQYMIFSLFF